MALLPKALREWRERRQILREVDIASQVEVDALSLDDGNLVNQAKLSLTAGDRQQALQLWQRAKERYWAFVLRYAESMDVALQLECYDDAEAIAAAGVRREPRDEHYAEYLALVSERRGDIEEALTRWTAVASRFPMSWKAQIHASACLRRLDRLDEAEEIARKALEIFPRIDQVRMEWIRCAQSRGDWAAVLQRAQEMYEELDHAAAAIQIAAAFEALGRLTEAADWLAKAVVRWPITIEFPVAQARVAYAQGRKDEAANYWSRVRKRFPLSHVGYQGELKLLRELGRLQDAEVVALEAIDRFPSEPWPAAEYARLSEQQKH